MNDAKKIRELESYKRENCTKNVFKAYFLYIFYSLDDNMEIVDRIPVELNTKELMMTQRLSRIGQAEIGALVEKARQLIESKAVYTFLKVKSIENNEVTLEGGYTLKSVILAEKLKEGQTVAPYVVTIGFNVEKLASKVAKDSILQSFILEKIADASVSKARDYIKSIVEKKIGGKVSGFGPGTGTGKLFDIKQQEVLFQILDPVKNIGVQLSPSYLMIPRKSASGVFAVIEEEYMACHYCPRKCDSRKKAFVREYRPVECDHEPH